MAEPAADKMVTRASDLKIGHLMLVKKYHKGPFDPTYIYNHRVAQILNYSMVLLTTLYGKDKKCNIHHVKLVSSLEVYVGSQAEVPIGVFTQFQDSINQNAKLPAPVNISNSTTWGQNKEMISIYLHISKWEMDGD